MFCPLCLSEFRDGFTRCSDCNVRLVTTLAEAENGRLRFWKGARQEKLDRILDAFAEAEIPHHFKELVHPHVQFSIMGIPIGKKKPLIDYELWIFLRDVERARGAVSHLLHAEQLPTG